MEPVTNQSLAIFTNKLPCDLLVLGEKKRMQARFLLGPAGSGKTYRCLAEIHAALANSPDGPPLIFLAPKQATFQLERQLLADDALPGYTRLNIYSFDRLARFILSASNPPGPLGLLSEEGRLMVLRALLMRHAGELKLFRQSARRPGFARQLSQSLGELQQHQYTPARLRALARDRALSRELHDKLYDLALLLEAYLCWLTEHQLQDADRLLDAATEALRKHPGFPPSAFRLSGLWLDGFAEMTPQELDLLAALLPYAERATLAFCLEAEPETPASWLSLWSSIGKTFQQCRQRVAGLPDCTVSVEILDRASRKNRFAENRALRHLEQAWPRSEVISEFPAADSIRLVLCTHPEIEATLAAREILKFTRTGGRFRESAVLVRNLDNYHKPLARVFRRYGIPFFLDRREPVAHHPLAELTRNALRTVAFDWQPDDWFAALKAGFSPVDETAIDRLENESLARGWKGARWREPFVLAENAELGQALEQLRRRVMPPFQKLAGQLAQSRNRPAGLQLADALRRLWSELGVEETLARWSLAGAESQSPGDHPSVHQTVWDQMNAWLDNIALAFADEPLSVRDWLPILEAGLANLTVGVIPPALDQVLIGAIDRARNPDLRQAFVLGFNEGIFPAVPAAPVILTEADRDELGRHAAALGPGLREALAREHYLGYIACTRATEKLVVTFARRDAGGNELNPSPFVGRLQRIFPALETQTFDGTAGPEQAEHAGELILPLADLPETGEPGRNWRKLLQIPALAALAENLRQLREPDPAESLSPLLAEQLFGPTLRTSVSRLEYFAACPFRFFVHSGLRAEERRKFELDAREQGSFQHELLKQFHDELRAEGRQWRDLAPRDARERVGRIGAGLAVHYRDGLLQDGEQNRFTARVLTESVQDFVETLVSWMRNQYDFDPAVAELDFGIDPAGAPAWTIELGDGHRLALRGRIDRIDLFRETDGRVLCVVMDYKSSRRKLDPILVEHGVQLQLLAYLAAVRRWPGPPAHLGVPALTPAGVFYVSLRGQYERGRTRDDALADAESARKRAYGHTGRFDASALPRLDRAGMADQFKYRLNKDGRLRSDLTEALPRPEFERLLDQIEGRLREMGRAIYSGVARVDPYRHRRDTACAFCDYRPACRIDPWTHPYRVLREAAE